MVGENSEGFPASKATTSETNLSTSSRPRPSSSGGNNQIDGVYARKRRDLNVTPHAFVLFSNVSTSSPMMDSSAAPLHDSTVVSSTELSLASDVNNAAVTNFTTSETTFESVSTQGPDQTTSEVAFETTAEAQFESTITEEVEEVKTTPETLVDEQTNEREIEDILNAKIDYEKAFDPDYEDDDDSTEVVEELREKPQKAGIPESISLKPSGLENPAAIQHDSPVYAYGQDEIEIVNLHHKTISTTAKSKAVYEVQSKEHVSSKELTDFNLAAEEFDAADVISIKSDVPVLETHDINTTNTDGVVSETNKSSKISVIEVPKVLDSLIPSKRILVNVTIATEPDSPNSPQSVYVLSVSLPTDNTPSPEINVNSQSEKRYHNTSSHESNKNTNEEPKSYGGECECSCPCLDPETSSKPDDVTFENATDLMSSTTETTIVEPSDSTTTEETWMTSTLCPEITTNVPPTPTILILEGRMLVRTSKNSD